MSEQEYLAAKAEFFGASDVLGQVMAGSAITANTGLAPMYGADSVAGGPSSAPEFNM